MSTTTQLTTFAQQCATLQDLIADDDKFEAVLNFISANYVHKAGIVHVINSMGEPTGDNEYLLHPQDGVWYITHKHVGSGEPLEQFLRRELEI